MAFMNNPRQLSCWLGERPSGRILGRSGPPCSREQTVAPRSETTSAWGKLGIVFPSKCLIIPPLPIETVKEGDRRAGQGTASVRRPKPGQDFGQLCQAGRFLENCNGAKFLVLRGGSSHPVA